MGLLQYLCGFFLHTGIEHSDDIVLEGQPAPHGTFVLQFRLLWDPAKKLPEQAKVVSPQAHVILLALFIFFPEF